MNLLEGILLGAVQGITEFLPISSSGHLVLAQAVLGVDEPGIFLEVSTHAATLLAILVYYRKKILGLLAHLAALPRYSRASPDEREGLAMIGFLLLGSVPAGLAGFLLKDHVESAFESPFLALLMLCVTGAFLLSTRVAPAPGSKLTLPRALAIGLAQAFALIPGISRSGSTIGTGLFLKIEGEKAAEFSFLLAVPAIAGASLIEALKLKEIPLTAPHVASFLTALVTGYAAIFLLLGVARKRSLWLFGFYCVSVGVAGMIYLAST